MSPVRARTSNAAKTTHVRRVAASPLEEISSPLDTFDDETVEEFIVSLNRPTREALSSAPELALAGESHDRFLSTLGTGRKPSWKERMKEKFRDFLDGVKVDRTLDPEPEPWLVTLTEIHRPKNKGCITELTVGTSLEQEYAFDVKVFNLGAEITNKRGFIKEESFKVGGKCEGVQVAVTYCWEECVSRSGQRFRRPRVLDIADTIQTPELDGKEDGCGFAPTGLKGTYVPPASSRKTTLKLTQGLTRDASFAPKVAGVEFGLKAKITVTRDVQFDYTLTGPCLYYSNRPGNGLVYVWNWEAGTRPLTRKRESPK